MSEPNYSQGDVPIQTRCSEVLAGPRGRFTLVDIDTVVAGAVFHMGTHCSEPGNLEVTEFARGFRVDAHAALNLLASDVPVDLEILDDQLALHE